MAITATRSVPVRKPYAGRLTRDDDALQEGLETMAFRLRDEDDLVGHLEAIERHAAADVAQARRHLEDAEKRQEETLARTETLRRHLSTDRRGFQELLVLAGWGHQLRPAAREAAMGTLADIRRQNGRKA